MRFTLQALSLAWYGFIAALLVAGWLVRDQRYLVAESGTGYWLGIIGGSMMLLLLIYPLRKRLTRWRFTGSIKFWFRLHMFLGVAGPTLVIYHTGYRLGSLNSRVALFCMLIVASSGLIGRYLYRRIHHGLYGEKIRFEELVQQDPDWLQQFENINRSQPEEAGQLLQIEKQLVNRQSSARRSLFYYLGVKRRLGKLYRRLAPQVEATPIADGLHRRIDGLRSICRLGINEILFSYWHILHFPLFIMLVISGFTHVIVVNFFY